MTPQNNEASVYKLDNSYRLVTLKGKNCSVFLKNKNNQLVASMEGCQNQFSTLTVNDKDDLTETEKRYLLSYIRAKKSSIGEDIAARLDVSVIKYTDGREEYLSEKQLLKKIEKGIDFAKIFVGKLSAHQITIPQSSKDSIYKFNKAEVSKVLIEPDCQITLDLRDNDFIETIEVGENFSGTINFSRSALESIFIGNNCTCSLTAADTKNCFNIEIGDIFGGNISISNCCLYAFTVGYYSYAEFLLADNLIKKDISIGDSFRGDFYAVDQTVDSIKIGNDCKGKLKISAQNRNKRPCELKIGDDFNGTLNLSGDNSVEKINIGRKGGGKLDASNTDSLKHINVGKFYNGNMTLSGSKVENISVAYGAKGSVTLNDCKDFRSLQATTDNKLYLNSNLPLQNVRRKENSVFYDFGRLDSQKKKQPFYKRFYQSLSQKLTF